MWQPYEPEGALEQVKAGKQKRSALVILIAAALVIVLGIALCFSGALSSLTGGFGGNANRPLTVAELIDLGDKYLLDLNYEQALV
jgi:flagellar basal body-associated protein FliL